jgi:metal-responsive CopG/Arc/MetJ family transcriptional regulator
MNKRHYMGKKHKGRHTTVIDNIDGFLTALENEDSIKSIQPGIIKFIKKRGEKLLIIQTPNKNAVHQHTLNLRIRTNTCIQIILIGTENKNFQEAIDAIKKIAQKKLRGIQILENET